MSWLDFGASIGSSLLQSGASSKAARRQQQAAEAASAKIGDAFESGKQLQMPYYNGGTDAFQQLMQRLPELTQGYDPSKLTQEPGYEWGRQQGQRALEGSLAAQGLTDSGAALKRAARYGNDYATTKLNDAFNRDRSTRNDTFSMLTGTAGFGERAGGNIAQQGNQAATQQANYIMGAGNAGAANDMAQGGMWGNLLNQGASMLKPMSGGGGSKGYGTGTGGFVSGGGMGNYLAEGGRVEPKVGTRAPLRSGGGGGLSRDAVLQELDRAWSQPASAPPGRQPGTVATLPADPTRNPRAITDDRMRKAGAYAAGGAVRSKDPGKADTVNAKLSGGEHVFDAELVAMLGDGNSDAGHALLEELKQRVRAFKRSAPADHTAPALDHGGR